LPRNLNFLAVSQGGALPSFEDTRAQSFGAHLGWRPVEYCTISISQRIELFMTKPTLTLLCLTGAASLSFGNPQPISPIAGKIPFRPESSLTRNNHIFQEEVQEDEQNQEDQQNEENVQQDVQSDEDDSYNVFYEQLADDGRWYEDDTYGYVFQPAVAADSSDWRPYSDGHWEDTDRGWYWDSNERFGWATYHYGRWVLIDGVGWVWVPGNEWAPAWVSWRDSDEYVGWAPLPPECGRISVGVSIGGWSDSYWGVGPSWYNFIPYRRWHSHSYVGAFEPYSRNVTIINRTRNVTNIYNQNSVINNFGPRPQQIAQRTNQRLTKYNINYMAQKDPRAFKATRSGNQLAVVGPKANLRAVATKAPPVAKNLANRQVNKGWKNVNTAQAAKLRTKLAQQNPVPKNVPKTTAAFVKPTSIANKGAGANNVPGNKPGAGNKPVPGNRGAGNAVLANPNAPNKGAGNGVLANQNKTNNANAGAANKGPNQLKSFKGPNAGNTPANPQVNKGAQGAGGNNAVNQGAQPNRPKSFKGATNPTGTKSATGPGGGNNAAALNRRTQSNQLKSFKNTTNTTAAKGAKGPGGANYGGPSTKKASTGTPGPKPSYQVKAASQPRASYQPKPNYQPRTVSQPKATYHPKPVAQPKAVSQPRPVSRPASHPPSASRPTKAPQPSGGGHKGGGGGGHNEKDKKKN
jgi:hypothetical protein